MVVRSLRVTKISYIVKYKCEIYDRPIFSGEAGFYDADGALGGFDDGWGGGAARDG
jgi:hypothetical protein